MTEEGITISASDEHPENIPREISVIVLGILIFVRDEHWEKQEEPIEVTDSGILNSFKPMHPLKAE